MEKTEFVSSIQDEGYIYNVKRKFKKCRSYSITRNKGISHRKVYKKYASLKTRMWVRIDNGVDSTTGDLSFII